MGEGDRIEEEMQRIQMVGMNLLCSDRDGTDNALSRPSSLGYTVIVS